MKSIQRQGKALKKAVTNEKRFDQCQENQRAFLSACSNLDEEIVIKMVEEKDVDAAHTLDDFGQNCLHFVVCGISNRGAMIPLYNVSESEPKTGTGFKTRFI